MMQKQILALLSFALIQLFGLLSFKNGFFLSRYEVPLTNTCKSIPHSPLASEPSSNERCWLRDAASTTQLSTSAFQKAIVIVIDALRFDFASFNTTLLERMNKASKDSGDLTSAEKQMLLYENHLSILHSATTQSPQRAKLFRFGKLAAF
jgi:phosphatidylinositol glycan class O